MKIKNELLSSLEFLRNLSNILRKHCIAHCDKCSELELKQLQRGYRKLKLKCVALIDRPEDYILTMGFIDIRILIIML